MTGGYGVDVVLNSLSGEMFRESCNLVAPFGRFVEIGRKDLMDDALMPMEFLLRNITFAYVDLTAVILDKKPLARRLLRDVAALADAGSIHPVTLTTMPISEIETAFRQIQAGKHTGKIILNVEDNQEVKVGLQNVYALNLKLTYPRRSRPCLPRLSFATIPPISLWGVSVVLDVQSSPG
jgi:emericellamide synthase (highly reducing iterative type I polyketide synthase)